MAKNKKIEIEDHLISIVENDFICLTDMIKNIEGGGSIIENWLRNKNTIEFIGIWEQLNNPDFNSLEFEGIKNDAGLNRFFLSTKKWIEKTSAIGMISKAGRYGGTYAHKDIAFEFGGWISPKFKLLLIREFQRLKEIESNQYNLEWNVKRILTKTNYQIHTDAIKSHIIPKKNYSKNLEWIVHAEEADLLNISLFHCTAKDWREANLEHSKKGLNIRDFASINELVVLSNLENINSLLITQKLDKKERFEQLSQIAVKQINLLGGNDYIKSVKKLSASTYIDLKNKKE
jgi:hypothetical protein